MPRRVPQLTLPAVLVASAVLMGAGLSACSKTQDPAALAAEAKAYQQKGDYKAAMIQLKNAVAQKPEDAALRLQLAALHELSGDGPSAEKEVRKAISLGTPAASAIDALVAALALQGESKKIIDESEPLLAQASADLLIARGNAFLQLEQNDKAKDSFEAALKRDPVKGGALVGLARCALATNNVELARQLGDQAAQKDPKNAEVWMFKGNLAMRENKAEPAIAAFAQALSVNPKHRQAHIQKAYVEISAGKFADAKADIDGARANAPRSLLVPYTQALLDHTEGKHAQALEAIQLVLKSAPEHMPSVLLAGAIQLSLGNYQQAEQHLTKYLVRYPDVLYARKMLATTQLRMSQPAEAANTLAPALGKTDDAQMLALAGESYLQARNFDKAAAYFSKASELAPKAAALHTSLGLSKLGQGDNAKAISELELAASMDPSSKGAGMALLNTQITLKQYDKALANIAAMEKQQPENAVLQNMKGGVYVAKNDLVAARAAFNKALELQPSYFAAAINLGQLDIAAKKPEDAKRRFNSFLEKDKKHVGALMALADMARMEGKPAEATTLLERAVADNPDAIGPAMQLAKHYLHTGEKQKPLNLVRKLMAANPGNPDLIDLLGQAQLANNDQDGALETYSKLAAMLPKSANAHLRLATVHSAMKNDKAALDDARRAVDAEPDNVQAQLVMVTLMVRAGDTAKALPVIRAIEQKQPKSPLGFVLEGDLLSLQKNYDAAARAYGQAAALSATPQLVLKQVKALQLAGKGKAAEQRLAAYKAEHPDQTVVVLFEAQELLAEKQYKPAIAMFEALLKKEPDNVAAINNLAWAYQQEKDGRALAMAERAARLAPTSPSVNDTLGWILLEQGNVERALPLLQQAVQAAPQNGEIRYHLAAALLKKGDKARAKKEIEVALAGKPFDQLEAARALRKQL